VLFTWLLATYAMLYDGMLTLCVEVKFLLLNFKWKVQYTCTGLYQFTISECIWLMDSFL